MSLMETVNKLGHYTKKATGVVKKPITTRFALAAIATIMATSELKAQYDPEIDTIYATGKFLSKDSETGGIVPDVLLSLRPESMAMVTPDTTYTFITNSSGLVKFENPGLPVYIDSTTGIHEFFQNITSAFPNPGSEINLILPSIEEGQIEYYNAFGQLVLREKFNSDHVYLNLDNVSSGIGVYFIKTDDGAVFTGKFMKQNVPAKGPAARPSTNKNSTFKETETYTATYWMKWEKEGYFTDSTLITLVDGENDPEFAYMTSTTIPIPQHQDIVGIAKDGDNNYAPLEDRTAILYNQTTNETIEKTTGSDGKYIFENIPAGSVCFISVGGYPGELSFSDIQYNVPQTIETMSDTAMYEASASLRDFDPAIEQFNVFIQQTRNGTQSQERKYYFDQVSSADQATYNSYYSQLDAMGNNYTHIQTTNPDEAQIFISNGSYHTNTDVEEVQTPFGVLLPVYVSISTMNTAGGFGSFSHEVYQQDAKSQCSGTGVLSSNPPPTGPDAQDLAIAELDMNYWVYDVYTNQETWFDLNKATQTLSSRSPQYKSNSFTEDGIRVNYIGK